MAVWKRLPGQENSTYILCFTTPKTDSAGLSQHWLLSCVELSFLLTSSAGHGVCTLRTHTGYCQQKLEEKYVLTAEPSLQPRIVLIFIYMGVLPAYMSIHYVPGPEEN